jgi:uncharacterized protein with GYD domain
MPLYLLQNSLSDSLFQGLIDNPHDRTAAARAWAESQGANLLGFWYALGEYENVGLIEAPDNATILAMAMTNGATGASKKALITPLMTADEAVQAMRKASDADYRRPGS